MRSPVRKLGHLDTKPSRVTAISGEMSNVIASSDVEHSPPPTAEPRKRHTAGRLGKKIRRSSAKVLSRLGLWKSDNSVDEPCKRGSTGRSVVSLTCGLNQLPSQSLTESRSMNNSSASSEETLPQRELSTEPEFNAPLRGDRASVENTLLREPYPRPRCTKMIKSPGLPLRLQRKWSIFESSTIVRHSRPKARIQLLNVDGSSFLRSYNPSDDQRSGTTEPSICESSVFSHIEYGSSSDGISIPMSTVSADRKNTFGKACTMLDIGSTPLDVSQCQPEAQPSIVTVEATAAAKVFLETYFQSIFCILNARQQRLLELQDYMSKLPFNEVERQAIRKAWEIQERDYLRQLRSLITRSNQVSSQDILSMSGYESVGVLGQGSFGIVKLVRERSGSSNRSDEGEDISYEDLRSGRENPECRLAFSKTRSKSNSRDMNKSKRAVYAMKVIRKEEMIQLCQEGHIRGEREFLALAEKSKWIVPLIASFQDTNHLYMIMEYEAGGDFFGLLVRQGILSERDAMWYVAEMILCVEETHRLGWIHRDVKPENFLITASGHLKIADFGLAFDGHWAHNQAYFHNHRYCLLEKLGIEIHGDTRDQSETMESSNTSPVSNMHEKEDLREPSAGEPVLDWRDRNEQRRFARSIVGTSQYMAPEIVLGKPYDGRCDYWSIGIILYECLYGATPFHCENRDDTKRWIANHHETLKFPQERWTDLVVSFHAIDLIRRLLQVKEFRLCSKQYKMNDCLLWSEAYSPIYANILARTQPHRVRHVYPDDASDIKTHRFFRDIPWNEMLHRPAPYVPEGKNWDETQFSTDKLLQPIDLGEKLTGAKTCSASKLQGQQNADGSGCVDEQHDEKAALKMNEIMLKAQKGDGSKRPRDKILRDAATGPTALDVRLKTAFVGYTWRRASPVTALLGTGRGRKMVQI